MILRRVINLLQENLSVIKELSKFRFGFETKNQCRKITILNRI